MPDSRVWVRPVVLVSAVVTALSGAVACGPSMRNLVESDMRFEHCYRIDDDTSTPLDNKRQCWSQWAKHYAKGQDHARVVYAKQRLKVLDGALASTPPKAAPVACPSPSSPYAPPPSVAPKPGGDVAAAAPPAACAEACTKTWRMCTTPCGSAMGCVNDCDEHFRTCVKACL